jgi:hypothetical protein
MPVSTETPAEIHIKDLVVERDSLRLELADNRQTWDAMRDSLKAKLAQMEHRAIAAECAHESANRLLVEAELQNETLRAEAFAWHKQAEERASSITVVLSLETLRRIWAMVGRRVNPCVNEED